MLQSNYVGNYVARPRWTPMQYFYYLRNQWAYTTRAAWLSTLMRFCSKEDFLRRLRRGRQRSY